MKAKPAGPNLGSVQIKEERDKSCYLGPGKQENSDTQKGRTEPGFRYLLLFKLIGKTKTL